MLCRQPHAAASAGRVKEISNLAKALLQLDPRRLAKASLLRSIEHRDIQRERAKLVSSGCKMKVRRRNAPFVGHAWRIVHERCFEVPASDDTFDRGVDQFLALRPKSCCLPSAHVQAG